MGMRRLLLPWGLHRILGIVTYLGIPPQLPIWLTTAGAVLSVLGLGLVSGRRAPLVGEQRVPHAVEPLA